MKHIIVIITGTLFLCGLSSMKVNSSNTFEPVAVIELFSSQGCSSCPPADNLLSKTIATASKTNSKVFALSFHVDYWNRLGWKDPFSDKQFSERQNAYSTKLKLNSNYTPQMVVNGTKEFIGSDELKLTSALKEGLKENAQAEFKKLELSYNENAVPRVMFELTGNYKDCVINLVLVSIKETTYIKRGENSGLTSVNENVVRQIITTPAIEKGEKMFSSVPLPDKNNTTVIAYIQQVNSLKIIGASQLKIN